MTGTIGTYAAPGADPFVVVVEVDSDGLVWLGATLYDEAGVDDLEEKCSEDYGDH